MMVKTVPANQSSNELLTAGLRIIIGIKIIGLLSIFMAQKTHRVKKSLC